MSTAPAERNGAANDAGAVPRGGGLNAITGAAREIFAERGYHGTSIRDIATRTDLSLSALYQFWADIIDDGIARGAFHCAHPDDARRAIVAACNAIAQWYEPAGDISLPDLIDRYTAIALRIVDHRN